MNNLENVKGIIGYKVFNPDWTCRNDFKYEVGKTYKHGGEIGLCKGGFHFCRKLIDCFKYYEFNPENKVALINANGKVIDGDDKSVTDDITIVEELNWNEVLDMVNIGKGNSGYGNIGNGNIGNKNSGNRNIGNLNSGDFNIGNFNSGDFNIGNFNSGDFNNGYFNIGNGNIGNKNSGNRNIGNLNSGNFNNGNYNSGDFNNGNYNSGCFNNGNYNSGCFNTKTLTIYMFNKTSDWTYDDWLHSDVKRILHLHFKPTEWIDADDMTDEEKEQHPEYKTTGGYLKKYEYKEACKNMWNELTEEKKIVITELPNFDKEIFKEITGIDVQED